MRNFIIWTLSILLGFEPALFAQGRAERMAEMKTAIEQSRIAQRPMKIRDLFQRAFADMPQAQQDEFKKFVETFGDYQLPKFDVSKTKGPNGSEYYRLQGVKGGQSVTVELIDDGVTLARVNGKNLTYQDMSTIQNALSIVGVPDEAINEYFPRKPANSSGFLNLEQFNQLKVEDRNKYMNQIRQLMESMEGIEYASGKSQKVSIENFNRFDMISLLLQGDQAWAAVGDCIAAGQIVKGGAKAGGSCGVDSKGNVHQDYRSDAGFLMCSNPKEILCDVFIYPSNKGICVQAGRSSTEQCNLKVKDRETFDFAVKSKRTVEQFQHMKKNVESSAEKAWAICQENPGTDGGGSIYDENAADHKSKPKPPPKKGSKGTTVIKKKTTPSDLKEHCDRFKDRLDEIRNWCSNPDYIKDYPALCAGQDLPTPPPIKDDKKVIPPPVTPPAETCPADNKFCCDKLPIQVSLDKGQCDESGGNTGSDTCYNPQTKSIEVVFTCKCPNGFDSKMKCKSQQNEESDKKSKDRKSKRDKKDGPNWLLVGGIVGLIGFLGYKVYKSATKQWYQNLEPVPQNPPIPPPVTPPAPAPQVQPPPPRGAV